MSDELLATLLARVDPGTIYLPLWERAAKMLWLAHRRGADFFAISGWRSYAQQDALYRQGRTAPGLRVTNAKAGESWHCFGLAVDFCRDAATERRGLQPDWAAESYELLGQCAREAGLEWGGDWEWPDRPHVQLAGLTPEALRQVREAFEVHGLAAAQMVLQR